MPLCFSALVLLTPREKIIEIPICLKDFPNKVVDNFNFLNLLTFLRCHITHQNPVDQAIQHCFIQLLNGCILPNFPDKGADFIFLLVGAALYVDEFLELLLVGFLLLLHGSGQLSEALLRDDSFGFVGVEVQDD